MSHAHCPTCRYAFKLTASAGCPRCSPLAGSVRPEARSGDALATVDAALDGLAVALGRLDDDELGAVAIRLVSTEHANTWAGVIAGAIAGAVFARSRQPGLIAVESTPEPPVAPPPTDRERALLALAFALLARLAAVTRDAFRRR